MNQVNQDSIIETLAESEETIGRLYQAYASRFPEYNELWMGLADQEKNHAAWIRNLGEKVHAGQVFLQADRFKVPAIRTFINHTEKEIETTKNPALKSINALSVAFYIEDSLIERKYFEVFESDSTELKKLLQDLAEATKTHATKIKTEWDKERQRTGKK